MSLKTKPITLPSHEEWAVKVVSSKPGTPIELEIVTKPDGVRVMVLDNNLGHFPPMRKLITSRAHIASKAPQMHRLMNHLLRMKQLLAGIESSQPEQYKNVYEEIENVLS